MPSCKSIYRKSLGRPDRVHYRLCLSVTYGLPLNSRKGADQPKLVWRFSCRRSNRCASFQFIRWLGQRSGYNINHWQDLASDSGHESRDHDLGLETSLNSRHWKLLSLSSSCTLIWRMFSSFESVAQVSSEHLCRWTDQSPSGSPVNVITPLKHLKW